MEEGLRVEKEVFNFLPNREYIKYQLKLEREYDNLLVVGKIDYIDIQNNIIYEVKLGIPNVKHLPIRYLKRVQLQLSLYEWLYQKSCKLVLVTGMFVEEADNVQGQQSFRIKMYNIKRVDVESYLEKFKKASLLNYIL